MKEVRRPNFENTLFPSNNPLNWFSLINISTEKKQQSKLGVLLPKWYDLWEWEKQKIKIENYMTWHWYVYLYKLRCHKNIGLPR